MHLRSPHRPLHFAPRALRRAGVGLIGGALVCWIGMTEPPPIRGADSGASVFDAPTSKPAPAVLEHYQSLYGADEQKAVKSGAKAQARFAAQLLDAGKHLKDDSDLASLVLDKAITFGLKDASGFQAAAEALKLLSDCGTRDPGDLAEKSAELNRALYHHESGQRRVEAGRALVDALLTQAEQFNSIGRYSDALHGLTEAAAISSAVRSSRTEEINALTHGTHARMRAREKLDKLLAKLRESPQSLIATEAATIYVTELDMPGQAAAVPGLDPASDLARTAALASGKISSMSEADCLRLGDWYATLAEGVSENGKTITLNRARAYYLRFLDLHDKKDADGLKAGRDLARIDKQLNLSNPRQGTADRIVIWNTHNGSKNDRGSTLISIALLKKGEEVWRKESIAIPWQSGQDTCVAITPPAVDFDHLTVTVTGWHGAGGGLSEIEVYKETKNLAWHAPVQVSDSFPGGPPASALTDGIKSSADFLKGYWLLPNSRSGSATLEIPAAQSAQR